MYRLCIKRWQFKINIFLGLRNSSPKGGLFQKTTLFTTAMLTPLLTCLLVLEYAAVLVKMHFIISTLVHTNKELARTSTLDARSRRSLLSSLRFWGSDDLVDNKILESKSINCNQLICHSTTNHSRFLNVISQKRLLIARKFHTYSRTAIVILNICSNTQPNSDCAYFCNWAKCSTSCLATALLVHILNKLSHSETIDI